jgi:SAM-dependent methyltransferase
MIPASRACPQCDGRGVLPLRRYSTVALNVVQCAGCNFVYLANAPDYDVLVSDLAWEKTFVVETDRRKAERPWLFWIDHKLRWRLKMLPGREDRMFQRYFSPGRMLDVGCGTGLVVPKPFIPFGIDISEVQTCVSHARMVKRGGLAIQAPAIEGVAQFPDRYFTGVLLRGLIEHEKHPKKLLRQVARVLSDDGAVYVKTPNYGGLNRRVMGAKWCGFRLPEHVNYFTLKSLRRISCDCGFTLKVLYPLELPFGDSIKALLRKV